MQMSFKNNLLKITELDTMHKFKIGKACYEKTKST